MQNATYKNTKDFKNLDGLQTYGKVVKVYDGDTFWVAVDFANLGVNPITHIMRNPPDIKRVNVRLFGVNCHEIRGGTDETKMLAVKERDYVRDCIMDKIVYLRFMKPDKYGRSLAKLEFDGCDLSSDLLSKGYASAYYI